VIEKHFFYNTDKSMQALLRNSKTEHQELITFREINHYHQTDAICIVPLEVCVKSSNKPHFNLAEIYLLNTQAVMLFLHKLGLTPTGFDRVKLSEHVNKHKQRFLEYRQQGKEYQAPII
jgi:hypothetical protein